MMDVMVDIETLSTRPEALILQIAAQEFDLDTGERGRSMDVGIDGAGDPGADMEMGTMTWWMLRDKSVSSKVFSGRTPVRDALREFGTFAGGNRRVWANSPSFDLVILRSAFDRLGVSFPIRFWNFRDMRTVLALARSRGWPCPKASPSHDAADDVDRQIVRLVDAWRYMKCTT